MNYYETLYIVHPALESGRLKDIILSLEESLVKLGGETLSVGLWGKKRLAYFIDKQKYGTYVQLQFTGEGKCTSSFGLELEHNPNILSYLTTLIEETDVVEQEHDLDTQIAGQSRESQRIDDQSERAVKKIASKDGKSAEESAQSDDKDTPTTKNDVDDANNKPEAEESAPTENNVASVKENGDNADEVSTVSEEK